MIPVIVLRPRPGGEDTVVAARAAGLDAHGFPLFAIAPHAWEPPPAGEVDALLLGSANAMRQGGAALKLYRGKPAYVVGTRTASAAGNAGFIVTAPGADGAGGGGLQRVLDDIGSREAGPELRLLRLAGATRVSLVPPAGVTIIERVVYASEPLGMPAALAAMLASPALVLLHSAEAARHFAAECDRLHLDRSRIALAALGPRIALAAGAAAGAGWRACVSASTPDDAALLALARAMCESWRQ